MKKIIIYILFLTAIVACWPEAGKLKTYRYTIRNESGKPIEIKAYNSYNPINPLITQLPIGGKIIKKYKDGLPPQGYNFKEFFSEGYYVDSLVIIYNKSKISFFKDENCLDTRNPLNVCEYQDTEELFIFTVQDYENAEDCNGNCD
ncbi:MAG: hypothetical protein L3J45_05925 [Flavobacteriaceae bacterium]|nr:hypothetical protein [Flavobacteriaceae bacterium]